MISIDDYRKRVDSLYRSHVERWRKRLLKGRPKGVQLLIEAKDVLPYTRNQYGAWLWSQIQLGAILCPYCRAAIDVLSMEVDHKVPFARGGGPELANQQVICKRCNSVKGDLTHDEYAALVAFFDGPASHFRPRIEGIMINGHQGRMQKFFPKNKKKCTTSAVPKVHFEELREF